MWKFENFTSQILREIDFCNFKTLKNVILINQKAVNFNFRKFAQFFGDKIQQNCFHVNCDLSIQATHNLREIIFGEFHLLKLAQSCQI